jgi:hypothetical protein
MRDRREEILTRLVTIAQAVPNVMRVYRNVDSNPEVMRPSIIIKDGEEEASDMDERMAHRFGIANLVVLTPVVTLVAAGDEETMPKTLSDMRMNFVAGVLNDAPLISVVSSNGYLRYAGATMTDEYGYLLQGQMSLRFNIRYPIIATDFV